MTLSFRHSFQGGACCEIMAIPAIVQLATESIGSTEADNCLSKTFFRAVLFRSSVDGAAMTCLGPKQQPFLLRREFESRSCVRPPARPAVRSPKNKLPRPASRTVPPARPDE